MLKPIPAKILKSAATVKVCNGVDRYQNQTYTEYAVKRVHLQPTNEIRKTQDNTDISLRSILFVDARISTPSLDWWALFNSAHSIGGDMKVVDKKGETFTVFTVDELKDDTDQFHHYEIGLR